MTEMAGNYCTALVVMDPAGLHLRPAAAIAQLANQFDAEVSVEYAGRHADGKSLLSICMLAAKHGAQLTVSAVGRDAQLAIRAIEGLLDRAFGWSATPPGAPDGVMPPLAGPSSLAAPSSGALAPTARKHASTPKAMARSTLAREPKPATPAPNTLRQEGAVPHRAKRPASRQVFFVWTTRTAAEKVSLAGDFNGWQPVPMLRRGNSFELSLELAPGVYQYKFLVDDVWQNDPAGQETSANGFGTLNNVIRVK